MFIQRGNLKTDKKRKGRFSREEEHSQSACKVLHSVPDIAQTEVHKMFP